MSELALETVKAGVFENDALGVVEKTLNDIEVEAPSWTDVGLREVAADVAVQNMEFVEGRSARPDVTTIPDSDDTEPEPDP